MPDSSRLLLGGVAALLAVLIPLALYLDGAIKEPRAEDVLLVSYPRSGSFWLRFMLTQAARGDALTVDFHNLEALFPDLEYGPNRAIYVGEKQPEDADKALLAEAPRLKLPPFYKSHQGFVPGATPPCDDSIGPGLHPFHCQCPNCPPKWKRLVYLVRDGRDTLCSYYHFQQKLGMETANSTFADFLAQATYPGMSWASHVGSYVGLPTPEVSSADEPEHADKPAPEVLWVRYEDIHEDPLQELRRIMTFLRVRATDLVLREAVRKSGFQQMKEVEEESGLKLFDLHHSAREEDFKVVRKGTVGSWRECFGTEDGGIDEETRKRFNDMALEAMKELGYVQSADWS